jgi:tRNA threonylcarbamoyladenosine modification (KEOPS) complex Cgi121 subunit
MEFISMIIKEFLFPEMNLNYYLGINTLIVKDLTLDRAFALMDTFQNTHEDVMIQFFNKNLILNSNHIFYAFYHTFKAFRSDTNISNKRNIEFLLYLAINRQIKRAIENFGITDLIVSQGVLDFCIFSRNKNLKTINEDILKIFNAKEKEMNLDDFSIDKYNRIKEYFEFNDNQIKTVLKSHGILLDVIKPNNVNIKNLYMAIEDLICEKMALLSIEKTTND